MHRHINLSSKDNICLYLANQLGCLFPCICWSKREKLQRLYEKSNERIDKELDLIKVVKNMKSFRVFLKNFLMTDKIKFELAHSMKNCIDIDTDSDEDETVFVGKTRDEVEKIKAARKAKKDALEQKSKDAVMREFYGRSEVKESAATGGPYC